MSTKNSPGPFNCYERAEPDEPMFVLLGRDPCASFVVEFWAMLRTLSEENGLVDGQVIEAEDVAEKMREWAVSHGKKLRVDRARKASRQI